MAVIKIYLKSYDLDESTTRINPSHRVRPFRIDALKTEQSSSSIYEFIPFSLIASPLLLLTAENINNPISQQ